VQNINEYPHLLFFGQHTLLARRSDSLLRMVEAARQQLRQPEGVARLVLEYAETIDFRHQSRSAAPGAAATCWRARDAGRLLFSGSVIFPARRLHFNAYKLDMSIVNDAQHDQRRLRSLLLPAAAAVWRKGGFTGEIYAVKIAGD
jgi:hypothetical protein